MSSRQKMVARCLLAFFAIAGAAWLARLDYDEKISTDVLDLVPVDERSPELALVRDLAGERAGRVALFAVDVRARAAETAEAHAARRERAASTFIRSLKESPAFTEVVRMGGAGEMEAIGAHVFGHRFELLLPGRLAAWKNEYTAARPAMSFPEWLARAAAENLGAFLAKPEGMAFQEIVPADPLLLVPRAVEPWQAFMANAPGAENGDTVLVWALASASPFKEEGQRNVIAAVAKAEAAAHAEAGDFELRWTAVSRFAEASRRLIEAEMSSLNLVSLAAVLAIGFLSVRRPYKALHLAPVLLFSLLGAWVATTAVFPRVHVMVFVIGSLLGGVAVDYGFYLFLQPARFAGESQASKIRRLLKPLLASALTTILGFSLLLFSDLPLIRQMGVFVGAGLLSALIAALLWFAQVGDAFWETRDFMRARLPVRGGKLRRRIVLVAALLVIVLGIVRLRWKDDVRQLEIPAPALRANDQALRALFGEGREQTVYLTRGHSAAEARRNLDAFFAWHTTAFEGRPAASLGKLLPTPEEWAAFEERLRELDGFEDALRGALAEQGFEVKAFQPFFDAWSAARERRVLPQYDEMVAELAGALRGPAGLLMETGEGASWFATLTEHPAGAEPPLETQTVSLTQLESLNLLFGRYRASALQLSLWGLGLVGASVLMLYGIVRGLKIFALPCGCCLFAFGVLGLAGQALNLFHLLGAFLGVCLSHNYAIFSAENAARGDVPPPSIRLSGLTTAASFGVLALSRIPVISALGTMVFIIVMAALMAVELEPFRFISREER